MVSGVVSGVVWLVKQKKGLIVFRVYTFLVCCRYA